MNLQYTWRESLDFQLERVERHLRADVLDLTESLGLRVQGEPSRRLDVIIRVQLRQYRNILQCGLKHRRSLEPQRIRMEAA